MGFGMCRCASGDTGVQPGMECSNSKTGWVWQVEEIRENFREEEDLHGIIWDLGSHHGVKSQPLPLRSPVVKRRSFDLWRFSHL